ncbi:MAG: ATP-binding cassette domain-containing protein, partial [Thermoanaerobaculia bacterium]
MIEARSLRKVFRDKKRGDVVAVDDLSFRCQAGEVFGLLGPNGAGKTTILRILSTALKPSSGTIEVDGIDVARDPAEVRRRIGFLSGNTGLYGRLTPREIIAYFGRLYGMSEDRLRQRTDELVERLGMADFADRRADTLSTGQKQKASIARTVVHEPPIVVFDEPTSGLDVMTSREIIRLIRQCKEDGRCVVFSTHFMSEAEKLCDRLAVIHKGKLFAT